MQVLRQATIDLLDAVLAERLPTSIPELLRLALERHHASLRAERKAADADRKQAKAASKAEEEAQRRDKAAKEQSVKEARKAAEAAEAALEKAKASAEAKARSEEKAAREAEAAAFEASEAKLRADEANATAEAAAEEADREARQEVQSDEQKRITAEAQSRAEKAQREAEKAEQKRRRAEDRALLAAEKHARRAQERAGAALDVAMAAAARVQDLGGSAPGERDGMEGAAGGSRASTQASRRLRRASDRLERLGAGGGGGGGGRPGADGDDDSELEIASSSSEEEDDDRRNKRRNRFYSSSMGSAAAEALEAELLASAAAAATDAELDSGSLEEEAELAAGGIHAHRDGRSLASGVAAAWPDGWRRGVTSGKSMAGYLTLQSITDCLASIDRTDLLVTAGSAEGEDGGLRVCIFSATEGRLVQSLAGHTQLVTSVACDGDRIASGSRDKTLRLWSRADGRCVATLACEGTVNGIALRGDSMLSGESGQGSGEHGKARLWQSSLSGDTGAHEWACSALMDNVCKGNVWSVALAPQRNGVALTGGHDGLAKLWPTDGTRMMAASGKGGLRRIAASATLKHPEWVCSVAITTSAGGAGSGSVAGSRGVGPARAVTGCADTRVRVWSLEPPCTLLQMLEHGGGSSLSGVSWLSTCLVGSVLLTGGQDGVVKVWLLSEPRDAAPDEAAAKAATSTSSGADAQEASSPAQSSPPAPTPVLDGRKPEPSETRMWECAATLEHGQSVRGLAASPALGFLASAGGRSESSVRVWWPDPLGEKRGTQDRSGGGQTHGATKPRAATRLLRRASVAVGLGREPDGVDHQSMASALTGAAEASSDHASDARAGDDAAPAQMRLHRRASARW